MLVVSVVLHVGDDTSCHMMLVEHGDSLTSHPGDAADRTATGAQRTKPGMSPLCHDDTDINLDHSRLSYTTCMPTMIGATCKTEIHKTCKQTHITSVFTGLLCMLKRSSPRIADCLQLKCL